MNVSSPTMKVTIELLFMVIAGDAIHGEDVINRDIVNVDNFIDFL